MRRKKKAPPPVPIEEAPIASIVPAEHAQASREVLYDLVVSRLIGGDDFEQIVKALRREHPSLSVDRAREVAREAEVLFTGEKGIEREAKRRAAERRSAIAMMRALANANRSDADFKSVGDAVRSKNDSLRTYAKMEELHARFTGAMEPTEIKVNLEVRESTVRVVGGWSDEEMAEFLEAGQKLVGEEARRYVNGAGGKH